MLRRSTHSLLGCGLAGLAGLAAASSWPEDTYFPNVPQSAWFPPWLRTNQAVASGLDLEPFDGTVAFFGDSILAKMNPNRVATNAVQFAVSGNFALALCRHVGHYGGAARRAHAAVIAIGTNDAHRVLGGFWSIDDTKAALSCIAKYIPVPVVWSAILHVSAGSQSYTAAQKNAVIDELNAHIRTLCAARTNCVFVETPLDDANGQARPELLRDGLHPNQAGYSLWGPALRQGLAELLGS